MVRTVLVLGASYAGLAVSHRLMKQTRHDPSDLRVVLVSKSTHFYWNLASIRAIIPGLIKDEALLHPIAPGFRQYPEDRFRFVHGSAVSVDSEGNRVEIRLHDDQTETIEYDQLVVATGARSASDDRAETPFVGGAPWKAAASYEETLDRLHKTQSWIQAAKRIVLAGAGPTGVETAAELAYEYARAGRPEQDKKEIILISAAPHVLPGPADADGQRTKGPLTQSAQKELDRLGVQVRTNVRVTGSEMLDNGKVLLTLSNGEVMETDVYLPTTGLTPNTEFLPASWLTERKTLDVDEFLRVRERPNVWGVGDTISIPRAAYVFVDKQAASVAKNIQQVALNKPPHVYKGLPFGAEAMAAGRERGYGYVGYVPMPSFLAYHAKVKHLGLPSAPKFVDGSQF